MSNCQCSFASSISFFTSLPYNHWNPSAGISTMPLMAEPGFDCIFFEQLFFVEHYLGTKLHLLSFFTISLVLTLFVTSFLSVALLVSIGCFCNSDSGFANVLLVSASAAFAIAIVALLMFFW